ncbi:CynX/NimT family MFS transporter [Thetidibacter halocola]|uniref:MFS transporter n=1 Tax=Thetidibacter halocola TaxID=2827239 RepID=A0A8J7WJS0_9RHOB|nr:MFS transporter [Thetidibacter halocola]MBS0126343.1 MFS transporter [Thetidibacter halocola]
MTSRWSALAILFTVRMTMGFQFQAVAATGPLFMERHGASLADLGFLIGLYMLPGFVIALPGGGIARLLGDKRVVTAALGLMVLGGLLMWRVPLWEAQVAGRVLAGTGGVLLNVLMSKMVQDWFAGREIATAMGIFVNSWPVGIALALVVLPPFAASMGLSVAFGVTVAVNLAALALFAALYRDAPQGRRGGAKGGWPVGPALTGILLAALIWGFYNAAIAMVFSFGPTLLTERGYTLAEASSTTSLALWLGALSVPAGGILADRLGQSDAVLTLGLAGFGATFLMVLQPGLPALAFVMVGLIFGLPAGPIMALPTRVLPAETRALGMGLFFTLYYVVMVAAPALAGVAAEALGRSEAAFWLGIGFLVLCLLAFAAFLRLVRAMQPVQ